MRFRSNGANSNKPGFLAVWSPFDVSNGCNSCDFPFKFGDFTFNSCVIVEGVDSQPWCSYETTATVIDDSLNKVICSDNDSSCPSTPPQMLITSPEYPKNYPETEDRVNKFYCLTLFFVKETDPTKVEAILPKLRPSYLQRGQSTKQEVLSKSASNIYIDRKCQNFVFFNLRLLLKTKFLRNRTNIKFSY